MSDPDVNTTTPEQALDDLERAIDLLAGVRAWLARHEDNLTSMTARDAHRLALCKETAWNANEALARASDQIGRMDLRAFGGPR